MDTVPSDVPEVWGGRIPQRNMSFTGREDLLVRLSRSLSRGQGPAGPGVTVLNALHGLGGVGKTQLAAEYAHRYKGAYDVVWWIIADQPLLVPAQLAALAPRLNIPGAAQTGREAAANAVLDALRQGKPYKRWLLIFDNADQPEDLADLLPHGPGDVLITSRNHRWSGFVPSIEVDVFTREESVEFLRGRLKGLLSEGEVDELAEALGDLPLALEQAAALQIERGMPIEEYLTLLRSHTGKLLREGKPTTYHESLTAAWTVVVSQLDAHLPEAVELLRYCAFLGPAAIPRDLFARQRRGAESRIGGLIGDPIRLSRVINELGRYALLKINPSRRTLEVHRLIQALIRNDLPENEQSRIRNDVQSMLAAAAPETPDDPSLWWRYSELVPHVRPVRIFNSPEPSVRRFALDIVRYLWVSGDSKSALVLIEECLDAWQRVGLNGDLLGLTARRFRGIVLRDLGQHEEAYAYNRETLELMSVLVGPDHESVLELANSVGADLRTHGDFFAARDHDADQLEQHLRKFGQEDPRTLRVMHNLALDYALTSDYPRSRELHNKTLRLQMVNESVTQPVSILASSNGLARALRLCGEYRDAVDLGWDARARGANNLGSDHPGVLRTAKDLAIALRQVGETDEASELIGPIVDRCGTLLGPNHPDTLCALMAQANILRTADDAGEALALAEDAYHRYCQVFGEDHPFTHGCAGNVALLKRVLGDADGARELNLRALAGLTGRLGPDHFFTLAVAVNLASDLAALGDLDGAIEQRRESLARLTALLGDRHPMTLACAANLSVDLADSGRTEEGTALYERTMGIYEQVMNPEHSDVVVARQRRHLDCDFDPPPI